MKCIKIFKLLMSITAVAIVFQSINCATTNTSNETLLEAASKLDEAFRKANEPLTREEEISLHLEVGRWYGGIDGIDGIRRRYLYWTDSTVWVEWYETRRNLRNIFTHGPVTAYDPNGNVTARYGFNYDQIHGDFELFWKNGQLASKGYFNDGVASGQFSAWNKKGEVIMEMIFDDTFYTLPDVLGIDNLVLIDPIWWFPSNLAESIIRNQEMHQMDVR